MVSQAEEEESSSWRGNEIYFPFHYSKSANQNEIIMSWVQCQSINDQVGVLSVLGEFEELKRAREEFWNFELGSPGQLYNSLLTLRN